MNVNETGGDHHALGVKAPGSWRTFQASDGYNRVAADAQVAVVPRVTRSIDNPASGNDQVIPQSWLILCGERNKRVQQDGEDALTHAPILTRRL
jgi:hypothetical protein